MVEEQPRMRLMLKIGDLEANKRILEEYNKYQKLSQSKERFTKDDLQTYLLDKADD